MEMSIKAVCDALERSLRKRRFWETLRLSPDALQVKQQQSPYISPEAREFIEKHYGPVVPPKGE